MRRPPDSLIGGTATRTRPSRSTSTPMRPQLLPGVGSSIASQLCPPLGALRSRARRRSASRSHHQQAPQPRVAVLTAVRELQSARGALPTKKPVPEKSARCEVPRPPAARPQTAGRRSRGLRHLARRRHSLPHRAIYGRAACRSVAGRGSGSGCRSLATVVSGCREHEALAGEPGDALGAEIDRNDHQPVRRARAGSPRVGSRGGRRSSWVVGRRSSAVVASQPVVSRAATTCSVTFSRVRFRAGLALIEGGTPVRAPGPGGARRSVAEIPRSGRR
jgi:hypothetical protein